MSTVSCLRYVPAIPSHIDAQRQKPSLPSWATGRWKDERAPLHLEVASRHLADAADVDLEGGRHVVRQFDPRTLWHVHRMPAGACKLPFLVLAVLVALATAGVAAAGNGGFAPVAPASPNAVHIQHAYFLILGFTAAIFILVETLLIVFIVKYRSRGRSRAVEGAQVHGHTRLELIWTAFPVVILAIIAGFVFYQLPDIENAPAAANPIHVTVEGHQFYWQFDYTDTKDRARSIGTLHVPAGAVVDLTVGPPT